MIRWKKKEEIKKELEEFKIFQIRQERNKLIARTDFFMLPDYPASSEEKEEVKNYRKNLREFPEKILIGEININNYSFPEIPKCLKNKMA